MIDPYYEARKWTWNVLKDDAGIAAAVPGLEDKVYTESPVPRDVPYPFIGMEDQGTAESRLINGDVAFFTIVLLVKVLVDLSADDSSTAAIVTGAIYDALQRKNGSTDLARIVSCQHQNPFRMPEEVSEGEWILHQGHVFRIQLQNL